MTTFSYAAYDGAGRQVEGQIEAASAAVAAEQLHRRGLVAYRTQALTSAASKATAAQAGSRKTDLSLGELASFARQLATLLQAELPLDQSLRLVSSQAGRTRIAGFADLLAQSVTAGRSLSATIELAAPNAPAFIAPMIRAGEARGSLTPCLTDLAKILERRVEVRSRMQSALVYPAILLVVALLTIALVAFVLVPTWMPLFKDSGATPPMMLQFADDLAGFLKERWPWVLFAVVLSIGAGRWLLKRQMVRAGLDRTLLRLPIVGALIERTNIAVMARTLGTLLRNGVPLVSALTLTATVASSAQFRLAVERATQAVKEGSKLATALQQSSLFPEMAIRFVAIGEESSKLDEMLVHLADVADTESHRRIEALLTLLTPLITLAIGLVIGGLIMSVMQAVLSVNEIATQ